jgi:hypothetical protein
MRLKTKGDAERSGPQRQRIKVKVTGHTLHDCVDDEPAVGQRVSCGAL